jgi:ParB-like chromosome segregation protein Spo0J
MGKYKLLWLSVNDIKPYENNPRINIGAIEPVAKSLQLYDWTKPIAIDKDYVIVCGHTRLLAAIQSGRDKVLCKVVDDLTPEQIKAYRLADNKLAEIATWNYAELIPELEYLQSTGIDISLLGMDIIDTSEVELEVKPGETEDNETVSPSPLFLQLIRETKIFFSIFCL